MSFLGAELDLRASHLALLSPFGQALLLAFELLDAVVATKRLDVVGQLPDERLQLLVLLDDGLLRPFQLRIALHLGGRARVRPAHSALLLLLLRRPGRPAWRHPRHRPEPRLRSRWRRRRHDHPAGSKNKAAPQVDRLSSPPAADKYISSRMRLSTFDLIAGDDVVLDSRYGQVRLAVSDRWASCTRHRNARHGTAPRVTMSAGSEPAHPKRWCRTSVAVATAAHHWLARTARKRGAWLRPSAQVRAPTAFGRLVARRTSLEIDSGRRTAGHAA